MRRALCGVRLEVGARSQEHGDSLGFRGKKVPGIGISKMNEARPVFQFRFSTEL